MTQPGSARGLRNVRFCPFHRLSYALASARASIVKAGCGGCCSVPGAGLRSRYLIPICSDGNMAWRRTGRSPELRVPWGVAAGMKTTVPLHQKLLPALSRIEREMIKAALREHRGRVEAAARALGISRKGLYLKRQRLGL